VSYTQYLNGFSEGKAGNLYASQSSMNFIVSSKNIANIALFLLTYAGASISE